MAFSLYGVLQDFLHNELGLTLHPYKTKIYDVRQGVEFLGAFVKPYRTYPSSSSLRRIKRKIHTLPSKEGLSAESAINSYLGVLSHYDSYFLRRKLFLCSVPWVKEGAFAHGYLKFVNKAEACRLCDLLQQNFYIL